MKHGYFTATETAIPAITALKGSFIRKMKPKTRFYTLFLPILLLTLASIEIRVERHEAVGISEQSDLRLAAWNIRIMSNKSRTDAELMAIARTLADYDFIAIVELRDEARFKAHPENPFADGHDAYDYQFSPAVGRGVKERCAFLYKKERVSVIRPGELYPDTADGKDDFIRDPYWATFRAGEFDFSVIAVHVIWGERVAQRKAEVKALADVYKYVQAVNGAEEDVLLVGDFNRNPTDADAYSRIMAISSMTRLFQFPQKSHIKDSSLYDNIFFQKDAVKEYLNRSGIDKFDETDFGNNDKAASLAVSDCTAIGNSDHPLNQDCATPPSLKRRSFLRHSAVKVHRQNCVGVITSATNNSQSGQFITQVYHQKRPHSALRYLTPIEFQAKNLA